MRRTTISIPIFAAAVVAAACSDSTSPASTSPSSAFLSTPAGFSSTDNTYDAAADSGRPWMPHGDRGGRGRGADGAGGSGMMGGGLGLEFFGGMGFERGWGHGPFGFGGLSSDCTLTSSTRRVSCPAVTRNGLTVARSFAFLTAAGVAQSKPDSTTDSINERIQVSGTVTRRDSAVSTVQHSSERTVTGLAVGSTQRTVNGASLGQEETKGTSDEGAFTATRLVADTTVGVVIPLQDGRPTYPIAGTVIRMMKVSVAIEGQSPTASSRREVVKYDGSATASVVITQDGTTKTCALPLPRGRLACN